MLINFPFSLLWLLAIVFLLLVFYFSPICAVRISYSAVSPSFLKASTQQALIIFKILLSQNCLFWWECFAQFLVILILQSKSVGIHRCSHKWSLEHLSTSANIQTWILLVGQLLLECASKFCIFPIIYPLRSIS